MSAEAPSLRDRDLISARLRIEELDGTGHAARKLIENFELTTEAVRGTRQIRHLLVELALRGRLVPPEPDASRQSRSASLDLEPAGLPTLPSEWVWATLGSIIKTGPKNGYSPKSVEYETPVKSLTLSATTSGRFDARCFKYIDEKIPDESEYWLRDGDLLVQRGNTIEYVGVAAVYRGPSRTFIYPDLMMRIRVADEVDVTFVHMALNGIIARSFMRSRASGTSGTMPKINQTTLLAAPIPVPPLAEQKRILARVDQLMVLIDEVEAKQNRKRDVGARFTKASLEALTTADGPEEFDTAWKRVVENWEIVLDEAQKVFGVRSAIMGAACRGLLTRRGAGTGQEMLARTAEAVRWWAKESANTGEREADRHITKLSSQRVEVPSIQLPNGWAWGTLLAVCTRLVDCHNKTAPYTSSGVMLLRTSNIRDGKIVLDGVKYVSEQTYAYWSRRCPPEPGDLIVTREAPMGEVALVEPGMRVCMGQRQMLLRVAPECVFPKYLLLALREPAFQARLTRSAVGSTVKHLRVGDVESLVVPVPPIDEQKRIVAKVEALMIVCDELEAKLRRAEDRASKLVEAIVHELIG